jgi:hypothetical protein
MLIFGTTLRHDGMIKYKRVLTMNKRQNKAQLSSIHLMVVY